MKRSPELKPNFWDGIVALAVIALAAAAALTVWQSRPKSGALTAVVSANGQEIDRFVPADLENELFASGGARLYADAFLSETARKSAAELAVNGQTAEVRQYCKSK